MGLALSSILRLRVLRLNQIVEGLLGLSTSLIEIVEHLFVMLLLALRFRLDSLSGWVSHILLFASYDHVAGVLL